MIDIQYSQKQAIVCSLKFAGVILILQIIYVIAILYLDRSIASNLIFAPYVFLGLAFLQIDYTDLVVRSISFAQDEITVTNRSNLLYSDTDEVTRYDRNDIIGTEIHFHNIPCLTRIKITFRHHRQLFIYRFVIESDDFEKILEYLFPSRKK